MATPSIGRHSIIGFLSTSALVPASDTNGHCCHGSSGCGLQCPKCMLFYACRSCHDYHDQCDHKLCPAKNRKTITHGICVDCRHVQSLPPASDTFITVVTQEEGVAQALHEETMQAPAATADVMRTDCYIVNTIPYKCEKCDSSFGAMSCILCASTNSDG